jgi:mRNA interferase RelE/StbE
MAWKIEFAHTAEKELSKLDKPVIQRILRFLKERVEKDPKAAGKNLQGSLSGFWRYRVGDYRLYADIQFNSNRVVIVKVGHRKDVYKSKS